MRASRPASLALTISSNARSSSGTRVGDDRQHLVDVAGLDLARATTRTTRRRAIDLSSATLPGHGYAASRSCARLETRRLGAADLGGVVLDPALEQRRQIVDAIAQRRHLDAARARTARRTRARRSARRPRDRRSRSAVATTWTSNTSARRARRAVADRALERALRRRRQIADVLDEQRAAGGRAQRAARALAGVVARASPRDVGALERRAHRDEPARGRAGRAGAARARRARGRCRARRRSGPARRRRRTRSTCATTARIAALSATRKSFAFSVRAQHLRGLVARPRTPPSISRRARRSGDEAEPALPLDQLREVVLDERARRREVRRFPDAQPQRVAAVEAARVPRTRLADLVQRARARA